MTTPLSAIRARDWPPGAACCAASRRSTLPTSDAWYNSMSMIAARFARAGTHSAGTTPKPGSGAARISTRLSSTLFVDGGASASATRLVPIDASSSSDTAAASVIVRPRSGVLQ